MKTVNTVCIAHQGGMSHATMVGPYDDWLVVSDTENWLEGEIIIASDTWINREEMR